MLRRREPSVGWCSNVPITYVAPLIKDKNINNYGYIGTSILRIYWIYRRIFWHKILMDLKLIKTYKNVTKQKQKQKFLKMKLEV